MRLRIIDQKANEPGHKSTVNICILRAWQKINKQIKNNEIIVRLLCSLILFSVSLLSHRRFCV